MTKLQDGFDLTALLTLILLAVGAPALGAQDEEEIPPTGTLQLTLQRMVDLALNNSYEVRQLNLDIEQTQLRLRAERARLRSSVDLEISAPQLRSISERRWNSELQRNEIAHENSRRWEAELSVRQPVILFGFPTNGYLSLNNRIYRFRQIEDDGDRDLRYYNRYFVRYIQPFFQPNRLKNDIERAELDLESAELDFYDDVVEIVDETSNEYYRLFDVAYSEVIAEKLVATLEEALAAAREVAAEDPDHAIDIDQIQVELNNASEELQQARSDFRLQTSRLKTDLNLSQDLEITLEPVIEMEPVPVDLEEATRFALDLNPRLRQLDISFREREIRLDETKGRGGFEVNLDLTYGREMQDEVFGRVWDQPTNTWTVGLEAKIPIWDWGERDARIQASEIGLERTRLRIERSRGDIRSDVENEVRNVAEFQDRATAMEENLRLAAEISRTSLERYRAGSITAQDLLQSLRREADTAENFLDAYLGWRRALLRLQEMTYFDFESGVPVLDRFGIDALDTDLDLDGAD